MTGQHPIRAEKVLLFGMMGSGKTSVGRALTERLGWPYRDNDEAVELLTGLPTRDLLERRGIAALRRAESQALQSALAEPPPLVAGVAGGVVESDVDLASLRGTDAFVVYLHAPLALLVARVGDGDGRPWLQPDLAAALASLFAGREPRYREVADLVVDTATGDAGTHADQIVEGLRGR